MQERAELLVETLEAINIQEGNLDDFVLDTIIINVLFVLTSRAN